MSASEILQVDPSNLHLPPSRSIGADPAKLQRQISRHGRSSLGMPPVWVNLGSDGQYAILDGVTRATRIAKLAPGTLIPVEVVDQVSVPVGKWPTIGDRLP